MTIAFLAQLFWILEKYVERTDRPRSIAHILLLEPKKTQIHLSFCEANKFILYKFPLLRENILLQELLFSKQIPALRVSRCSLWPELIITPIWFFSGKDTSLWELSPLLFLTKTNQYLNIICYREKHPIPKVTQLILSMAITFTPPTACSWHRFTNVIFSNIIDFNVCFLTKMHCFFDFISMQIQSFSGLREHC